MQKFVVVERVQEPVIWGQDEPEVRMIVSQEWYKHRHRIVAAQEAERRARIVENVKNTILMVTALLLIFGSCVLFGGY